MQYQVSRMVAGPLLRMLARPTVIGAEHIPPAGPAIIASNHLSVIDSIYLPLMVERPVSFAAKSEYFTGTRLRDRAVGAYLRATNQLSTDRTGGRAAQAMLEAALAHLSAGQLFGIYPEGTRSPDGRLYTRPHRHRVPGPALWRTGHPGRHGRHREDAAARPPNPETGQDRDPDRRTDPVRRIPRAAGRCPAAAGRHR